MKVNASSSSLAILNRIKDRDGSAQEHYHAPDGEGQKKNENKQAYSHSDAEILEVTDERVQSAIANFQKDENMAAAGLSVVAEGRLPGLKIYLKDVSGNTVRQFSAEEFLKLRDSSSQDHRARGKILDQKC